MKDEKTSLLPDIVWNVLTIDSPNALQNSLLVQGLQKFNHTEDVFMFV